MDYKGLKELLEGCINDKCEDFPAELDSLIADTARTGIVRLPWKLLKPLFNYRLQKVFDSSFDENELEGEDKCFSQQLLTQLNKFDNPPFTIQRLCELIVDPKRNYKRRDRHMRAIERCLLVVSTHEPDLTWMKSPRLTQLLEEPPKEGLQEVVFDDNMVKEFSDSPASGTGGGKVWSNLRQISDENEQPFSPSESDQATKLVKQDDKEKEEKEEASTSSTEEMLDDKDKSTSNLSTHQDDSSDSTPESSSNSPERGGSENKPTEGAVQFPLSRKRSSSLRESLDSSGSEGTNSSHGGGARDDEENDRGTVLQEADSTTLGEQEDNGLEEEMGEVETERREKERGGGGEDEDRDLEQSTPKKMRSHSPEVETEAKTLEGVSDLGTSETAVKMGPPEVETKGGLKDVHQSSAREEEEVGVAPDSELHSCSERETSTGQLEGSHGDGLSEDKMETS